MNPKLLNKIRKNISRQRKIVNELNSLLGKESEEEIVSSHVESLRTELKKLNTELAGDLKHVSIPKSMPAKKKTAPVKDKNPKQKNQIDSEKKPQKLNDSEKGNEKKKSNLKDKAKGLILSALEKKTLKRLGKDEKKVEKKKEKKPSKYVGVANRIFSKQAKYLVDKGLFGSLEKDLIKGNMKFLPKSYVAVALFTTLISLGGAFVLFLFLMFFNLVVTPPFVVFHEDDFLIRFLKVFWILFVIPILTFVFTYFYPSMEKRSIEKKINAELPFASINMSAISGSMIEPSNIFSIIIETKEYPNLEKEFSKIINGINVLGYDLVTALRNGAFSSPSGKLSDLFNGLATTINSGGDLRKFFNERSERLLFEYNLEKEKSTRTAETFMDIYISVVIAAPMILMLLLMMMQISGIGLALSTSLITLIMVLGVTTVNIIFLTFLHLRQSNI